jgi:hypothetical protein
MCSSFSFSAFCTHKHTLTLHTHFSASNSTHKSLLTYVTFSTT